jgi:hypothetical protein
MALGNPNYELEHLLKIWGIELKAFEHITIYIDKNSIVTVHAVHSKEAANGAMEYIAKEYALVELKNE